MVVLRIVVTVSKIPPVYVVDKTVGIIVDPVPRYLTRVFPYFRGKVGMGDVHPRVQHRDNNPSRPLGNIPCLRPLNTRGSF
jgi:hypothetical protein